MSEETYHWRAVILFAIIAIMVLPFVAWMAPDSVKSVLLSSITNDNPLTIMFLVVIIIAVIFGGFAVFTGDIRG